MSGPSDVELKGSMYTFLSLKLHTVDPNVVKSALADKVQQAPGFFNNAPVVVDLSYIEDQNPDVAGLLDIVRSHKLCPIVASLQHKDSPLAADISIPLVEAGPRKNDKKKSSADADEQTDASGQTTDTEKGSDADNTQRAGDTPGADDTHSDSRSLDPVDLAMAGAEVEYIIKEPLLVKRPVRSGQQLYARDTDLIVLGQIGPGAEIIADNNIHVYGPLRGRALCGVSGNTDARIFCQSLEAELVSVAGNYKVLEEIPEELRGKPAQISFSDNRLRIEPL
ncbi:MAG: septum site-determining protein MinC [Gammaproteobacteria bacterium]|nr:septum site-determining protein MinC [Gammaproteobacteria bacterium]